MLKQLLIFGLAADGFWAGRFGEGGQGYVGLAFTLPFVVLSPWFGQFADRWSKSRVTWAVKVWEVLIALAAWLAFLVGSPVAAMVCMILLATQSALYGPTKYGIIPELVARREVGPANGVVNLLTNVAIIGGTAVAAPVAAAYRADATWVPGAAFVVIALLGLAPCLLLPALPAGAPALRIKMNVFGTLIQSQWQLARSKVFLVALLDAIFYFIGMLAILALPDFQSPESGGLTLNEVTVSLVVLALAIGVGSAIAGRLHRARVRPILIPIGCAGMAVGFAAIGILPVHYWRLCLWLAIGGVAAGAVVVTIQTMLILLIAEHERGRVLGAVNTLSFLFMAGASLLYTLLRDDALAGLSAPRIFLVCAAIALPGIFVMGRIARQFGAAAGDAA